MAEIRRAGGAVLGGHRRSFMALSEDQTMSDAGAMAEAREIVVRHMPAARLPHPHYESIANSIATALTRREAAGFARGVEAVCKIAEEYISGEKSGRFGDDWAAGEACAARDIASAGRALLGEGKE
jgi:hypothetical protein